MAFSDLIRNRYSVRGYKPDPVEKEKLEQVLEAARLAPTAANRQRFQLIVIHTEGRKEELARIRAQSVAAARSCGTSPSPSSRSSSQGTACSSGAAASMRSRTRR